MLFQLNNGFPKQGKPNQGEPWAQGFWSPPPERKVSSKGQSPKPSALPKAATSEKSKGQQTEQEKRQVFQATMANKNVKRARAVNLCMMVPGCDTPATRLHAETEEYACNEHYSKDDKSWKNIQKK